MGKAVEEVAAPDLDRAIVAARRRLIPFLFLLYIVAYLDRINVGFASLQMNDALGFRHGGNGDGGHGGNGDNR